MVYQFKILIEIDNLIEKFVVNKPAQAGYHLIHLSLLLVTIGYQPDFQPLVTGYHWSKFF